MSIGKHLWYAHKCDTLKDIDAEIIWDEDEKKWFLLYGGVPNSPHWDDRESIYITFCPFCGTNLPDMVTLMEEDNNE
jgi:hypothetical protein